ncbi:putative prefoldin subunit 2 [Cladophialophora carrionii]|uniref:Putative prefoldin subunit 2 n=1 Tax=Cladophialophora carrionii TaxID=86049 RepID=A0A1C1D0J5_9EURO|nr:putative prefoldin subunit 2 [Cladophialophora carrionii]
MASGQEAALRKQQGFNRAENMPDLQSQYSNYKDTLQSLAQKVGEIEQEIEEHKLVMETLEPLPQDRKCFRLINGVLVERTVKDVLPALKTNSDGLKQVLEELLKQYKAKQDEMDKWKVVQNQ